MIPLPTDPYTKLAASAAIAVWEFLVGVPKAVWLCLLAAAAIWLTANVSYEQGQKSKDQEWKAKIAKANRKIEQLNNQLANISPKVERVVETRIVTVEAKAKIIKEKVPYYVPIDSPPLPGGFRLLHDAAAGQTDPPDSSAAASAAAVSAQDAAATVIDNYAAASKNAALVEGWQLWWQQLKQACEGSDACAVNPPATGAGKD